MPRFDGTGPFGQGPMGRGLGPCGAGRRTGFGTGYGCGFRGFGSPPDWNRPRWGRGFGMAGNMPQWSRGVSEPQDEVQFLKQQASYLQNELDAIQKRLTELESA